MQPDGRERGDQLSTAQVRPLPTIHRGHFDVAIVSVRFAGLAPLARHRAVYAALGGRMGGELHALQLTTAVPTSAE